MSDESGSSGKKRPSSEISQSQVVLPLGDNPRSRIPRTVAFEDDLAIIQILDGWDDAQEDGKPPLEPKNTDDRTMRIIKGIPVLDVLQALGYKENDQLPTGNDLTPVEVGDDLEFDYYPTGLVNEIIETLDNPPDEVMDTLTTIKTEKNKIEKSDFLNAVVENLAQYKKPESKEDGTSGGRKKRRRKTRRRKKSRRKRKTKRKKRKKTRRKRKRRRKKKTRR